MLIKLWIHFLVPSPISFLIDITSGNSAFEQLIAQLTEQKARVLDQVAVASAHKLAALHAQGSTLDARALRLRSAADQVEILWRVDNDVRAMRLRHRLLANVARLAAQPVDGILGRKRLNSKTSHTQPKQCFRVSFTLILLLSLLCSAFSVFRFVQTASWCRRRATISASSCATTHCRRSSTSSRTCATVRPAPTAARLKDPVCCRPSVPRHRRH